MRCWVVIVLGVVSCGGNPVKDTISNKPSGPAAPSCADAGTILRGPLVSDDPKAGLAREAAIAQACRDDNWAPEILSCVVSSRTPRGCTDKLTKAQQATYQAKLEAWNATYGGEGYGGDAYGGDMYGGVVGGVSGGVTFTACSDAVTAPERFAPVLDPKAPEHDWVLAKRRAIMIQTCETNAWEELVKECVQGEPDSKNCVDDASRKELVKRFTEVGELGVKIAAAKKKPASIDCAKVVTARYGDAMWKDKLAGVADKDRKKQIAESRKAMQKGCVADKWTDTLRACLVSGGGDGCFDSNASAAVIWGYPALSTATWPGMPLECQAYKALVDRLATCDKLPQATRDALKQGFDAAAASWQALPKDGQAALVPACQAATDALLQVGSICGW